MTSFVWQFLVSNELGRSGIFFCRSLFYLFFSRPVPGLVLPKLCLSDQYITGNLLFGDGSDQIKALHVGFIVCVSNPLVHCNDSYDNFFIHIPFSPNAVIENHRLETEIYHDFATWAVTKQTKDRHRGHNSRVTGSWICFAGQFPTYLKTDSLILFVHFRPRISRITALQNDISRVPLR